MTRTPGRPPETPVVFETQRGGPYTGRCVQHMAQRDREAAGLGEALDHPLQDRLVTPTTFPVQELTGMELVHMLPKG